MTTEAEKQLAKLVAMPTITDDIATNDRALDYIENYFKTRGLHCQRGRYNGRGTLMASSRPDNAKKPKLLLAGHVDVVTGSDEVFELKVAGDKLLGRGVYDMKFAIAGYMQLVDELQGKLQDYDFAVMVTTDEECGGQGGISGTKSLIEDGYGAEVCIVPDSTAPGWDIEVLTKGVWRFDITSEGRSAHGSRPWEGDSASFKLIPALYELQKYFKGHGPETETLNIAIVQGGEEYSIVPALMTASIEIRIMDEESYTQKTLPMVQKLCQKHGLTLKTQRLAMPVKTDLTQPIIQSYMDSVEKVTGRRPRPFTSFAFSDSLYLSAANIPCIVSCPAGGGHHSEGEWLDRKNFKQFVPILRDFLDRTALKPGDTLALG